MPRRGGYHLSTTRKGQKLFFWFEDGAACMQGYPLSSSYSMWMKGMLYPQRVRKEKGKGMWLKFQPFSFSPSSCGFFGTVCLMWECVEVTAPSLHFIFFLSSRVTFPQKKKKAKNQKYKIVSWCKSPLGPVCAFISLLLPLRMRESEVSFPFLSCPVSLSSPSLPFSPWANNKVPPVNFTYSGIRHTSNSPKITNNLKMICIKNIYWKTIFFGKLCWI